MVEELIKHHWCDKCGYDQRVEGRGIAIAIDGQGWEIDLCLHDEETEIQPLLRFLEEFARPMGGKPAAAPAAKTSSKPSYDMLPGLDAKRENVEYPCPLCPKNISSGSNLTTHLKGQHDTTFHAVYGTVCPECRDDRLTYMALSRHVKADHNTTVPRLFMIHILQGDPSGIIKRRGLMPT